MVIGRTTEGLIKIKTDDPLGLRAVPCACCSKCWIDKFIKNGTFINLTYSGDDIGTGQCEELEEGRTLQRVSVSSFQRTYILNTPVESSQSGLGSMPLVLAYNLNYYENFTGCEGTPVSVTPFGSYAEIRCLGVDIFGNGIWGVSVQDVRMTGGLSGSLISKAFNFVPTNGQTIDSSQAIYGNLANGNFTISWDE